MVGVPPLGGFFFPAEAGTPTRRCSHLETEEPKQNRGAACHRVALSSRQCSSLATYLVRSIYDGRWCEEGQNCEESDLGDPRLQGNGRRFTAETAVPPGGTVVPTVFFPGDVPCAFNLRWTLVRRGTELRGIGPRRSQATRKRKEIHCRDGSATGWHCRPGSVLPWRRTLCVRFTMDVGAKRDRTARNRTSAIPGYKETEEDSLPRRQCHRVALSSRQCSSLATYLVRSIHDGRWCEEGQNCEESDLGDPRLQGNGRRFTAETAVPPRGTVVPTVFFPRDVPWSIDLRWTLVRRGTERRGIGPRRSQATRKRKKIHCRDGSATGWHCRSDSVLPWRRTLCVQFTMDVGAKRDRTARNRTSAIPGYKETEGDSLPRRNRHPPHEGLKCVGILPNAFFCTGSLWDFSPPVKL